MWVHVSFARNYNANWYMLLSAASATTITSTNVESELKPRQRGKCS